MINEIIPISIFQNVIFEYCNGDEQIILKSLYYNDKLEIMDLYDVDYDVLVNLTDKTLKKYPKLKKLDITNKYFISNIDHLKFLKCLSINNLKNFDIGFLNLRELHIKSVPLINGCITDKHIKQLTNLKILDISNNHDITNESIKYLDLVKLNITNCDKITDEGIKHMINLKILNISGCKNLITDKGIKHLYLDELVFLSNIYITDYGIKHMDLLCLQVNDNITNNGIKHMTNLKKLSVFYNNLIGDEGIKNMNLKILSISHNNKITDNGIKHMQFHELYLNSNKIITDEGIKNSIDTMKIIDIRYTKHITNKYIQHMNLEKIYTLL